MRHWIKEPLVHFILLGGLLFVVHANLNRGAGDEPRVVRITAAEVNWLKETWARQWRRPPSDPELRSLVADHVKEVLLAREATALGLDEDDMIVRRRLAQKMEFLVQDTARLAEPREDELRRLYDSGGDRYQAPARISFDQIYFETEAAARGGMRDLETRDPAELGDRTLLAREYEGSDEQTVAAVFGPEFAEKIFRLEPRRWSGPVASGYGFHLVRVSDREDPRPRPFDEVRAQVLEEWHRAQQAQANEQFLARLLRKYELVVDEPVKSLIGPLAAQAR